MRLYHKPFDIGLKPIGQEDWFDVDEKLDIYLAEKERLLKKTPDTVFLAEDHTEAAQVEVFNAISAYLLKRYRTRYRRDGPAVIVDDHRRIDGDQAIAPLLDAARLVQDDLVLMRADNHGWRLVAGSVSFPSSWDLSEKFGASLERVHAPVPDFGAGTRNASVINRIFTQLEPDARLWRQNWGLYEDENLHHPFSSEERAVRLESITAAQLVIRVERQTIWKLPVTGDILFSIRIYLDRLSDLNNGKSTRPYIKALVQHLRGMNDAHLTYKGLAKARDHLVSLIADAYSGCGQN